MTGNLRLEGLLGPKLDSCFLFCQNRSFDLLEVNNGSFFNFGFYQHRKTENKRRFDLCLPVSMWAYSDPLWYSTPPSQGEGAGEKWTLQHFRYEQKSGYATACDQSVIEHLEYASSALNTE